MSRNRNAARSRSTSDVAHFTNLMGLPDAFVAAVTNDPYTPGQAHISNTRLIDSPQVRMLSKKYGQYVVEDVSERVWSLLGQAVHTILERANRHGMVEERLYMEVEGWTLSGAFDRMDLLDETLQDYKVCSTYKSDGDASWERQLNVLRQLAKANGYKVERLQVIAIFRDWSKTKAQRDPTYPQAPVGVIDVPVWDDDAAMAYISERIRLHQRAEQGEEVLCTDEDRWFSGHTYALIKKGNKKATKIAATREELGEPQPGFFIEERRGVYRRCDGYCPVREFCSQNPKKGDQNGTNASE